MCQGIANQCIRGGLGGQQLNKRGLTPLFLRLIFAIERAHRGGSQVLSLDVINVIRYYLSMIKTFRDRDTERIFKRQRIRRFSLSLQKLCQRKLDLIDGADLIEDLRTPPGNRLEKLSGNRKGQYSIRVNDQWRICFRWKSGQATDVEIVDYH